MSSAETQAERRRLRREKILADSEKRLNRIVSGNSEPVATPEDCDTLPAHSRIQPSPSSPAAKQSGPTVEAVQASAVLPPRESETFPRKVSLISSPIHYKTLQLSKQYNSMLNHPNIVNNLRCNTSAKFMLFLILLSFVCSLFNANIPVFFVSYLLIKHAYNGIYRNIWFDINLGVFKELFTFVFSYICFRIITQVTVGFVAS